MKQQRKIRSMSSAERNAIYLRSNLGVNHRADFNDRNIQTKQKSQTFDEMIGIIIT